LEANKGAASAHAVVPEAIIMRRTKPITRLLTLALAASAAAAAIGCSSNSHTPATASATVASHAAHPVMDERAISILKEMSDTLAKAQGFSFSAVSSEVVESPAGEWVHVFGTSRVTFQRPGSLVVETGGDLFEQTLYYDGDTATMYARRENLYAQEKISDTVEKMLQQIFEKHGDSFAFADVLHADPYHAMAKQVAVAELVGRSTLNGVPTDHIAFSGSGMQWELWVGVDDKLPRMLGVTFRDIKDSPTNTVSFYDWKLNPQLPAETFRFTPPSGATRIEHKKPAAAAPSPTTQLSRASSAGEEHPK
jgi:hypothetical protein